MVGSDEISFSNGLFAGFQVVSLRGALEQLLWTSIASTLRDRPSCISVGFAYIRRCKVQAIAYVGPVQLHRLRDSATGSRTGGEQR